MQTINCSGEISGLVGPASALNGLDVVYDAVVMDSGDVYATASVNDEYQQVSATAFYAWGQVGSTTAIVTLVADFHSTADWATWDISLNRNTFVTSVKYTDASLGGPVNLSFAASACAIQNW